MPAVQKCINSHRDSIKKLTTLTMHTHLNADAMITVIRRDFAKVADHRASNVKIPLVDALMSGFAMFALKGQSLLAFDKRRCEEPASLHDVFGVGVIPCDSQMRAICDEIFPQHLRRPFRSIFHQAQRGMRSKNAADGDLRASEACPRRLSPEVMVPAKKKTGFSRQDRSVRKQVVNPGTTKNLAITKRTRYFSI